MSIRYTERLEEAGLMPSVGSPGDSYDNALAETINGLYKTEVIYKRGPWKTRESLELATLQWVHWFNHGRLLESIGHIPPAEAEANYWRQVASILSGVEPPRKPVRFMVSNSIMASSVNSTSFNAMLKRCLTHPLVARSCQTKKEKSPQLRGLSGFLCHQVPVSARRGIIPTRL